MALTSSSMPRMPAAVNMIECFVRVALDFELYGHRRDLARRPDGPYLNPVSRIAFLPVANPKLRSGPPTGPDWLHEIKFDGFRIQLHKSGDEVRLFSRNGKDFTARFPLVAEAVRSLPTRSAVIDGELVACDAEGKPDFYALMRRYTHGLCIWCFDLLVLGGSDLRPQPCDERKGRLEKLLAKAADDRLRHSLCFDDGRVLLEAAARMNLEGIVSKKRRAPYVAGSNSGWVKVKTREWRDANRERYKLFEKA
jgi:bifunctional non-homologous end joining protein LigD